MTGQIIIYSLLMVISTLTLLQSVDSLKCYRCMYLKGITFQELGYKADDPYLKLDYSCESSPSSKYLQDCSDDSICHSNIVEEYSHYDEDDEHTMKIVDRGCIEKKKLERVEMGCASFESFEEFREMQNGPQKPFPFEIKLSPALHVNFTRCHCHENGCNSSSHGPTFSFWLIFLATVLLAKLA